MDKVDRATNRWDEQRSFLIEGQYIISPLWMTILSITVFSYLLRHRVDSTHGPIDLPAAIFTIWLFLFFGCQNEELSDQETTHRPNILLLVADDLGYSDLGSYGSNINTPNLDQLADDGLRFSRFYTAPICAPSRAMLLSGNDNHVAGMGSQFRSTDFWGYEGHLTNRIATIPQLLRQAGYHTYMTGKWHLGDEEGQLPPGKGFDRSFVLHQSAANHYNNTGLFYSYRTADYSVDGRPVSWPEAGTPPRYTRIV